MTDVASEIICENLLILMNVYES